MVQQNEAENFKVVCQRFITANYANIGESFNGIIYTLSWRNATVLLTIMQSNPDLGPQYLGTYRYYIRSDKFLGDSHISEEVKIEFQRFILSLKLSGVFDKDKLL